MHSKTMEQLHKQSLMQLEISTIDFSETIGALIFKWDVSNPAHLRND